MSQHPVLHPDVNHEDIQGGLKLEHLVDNSRTTMDRLFSSSLRVLVEANIEMVKAASNTIEPNSLKNIRDEYSRDIDIIAPHTKALVEEGGNLPYEDPVFILAVCNLFVNMVTVVEHVTKEMEREALKGLIGALKDMAGALKDAGADTMVLAGTPEEVASALEKMGATRGDSSDAPVTGTNPTTAMTDETGKPPIH